MAKNPVKLCALTSPNFGHFVRSRHPTLGTPDFGETPDSGETVCGHLPLPTADHLGTEGREGFIKGPRKARKDLPTNLKVKKLL